MIMSKTGLVLALDTSTVVNVGLASGDRALATATVARSTVSGSHGPSTGS